MSIIEIIGFATALMGVYLTIRQNIWCWLFNIISSLLYCIYFFELKLYADAPLQLFFVGMSIYGWISWLNLNRRSEAGSQRSEVGSRRSEVGSRRSEVGDPASIADHRSSSLQSAVTRITVEQSIVLSILVVIISYLISNILLKYTDASLPYADSFCMALSLAGTWMAAKKLLENWIVWIVADILYVGIYIYKDSYLTALLYLIFVALAVSGYIEWKRSIRKITL